MSFHVDLVTHRDALAGNAVIIEVFKAGFVAALGLASVEDVQIMSISGGSQTVARRLQAASSVDAGRLLIVSFRTAARSEAEALALGELMGSPHTLQDLAERVQVEANRLGRDLQVTAVDLVGPAVYRPFPESKDPQKDLCTIRIEEDCHMHCRWDAASSLCVPVVRDAPPRWSAEWISSSWGSCSALCGEGSRHREVQKQFGV